MNNGNARPKLHKVRRRRNTMITKSRTDIARELVASLEGFVIEHQYGELQELAMSPGVTLLQLAFLENLTANVQRLRSMLRTWRKDTGTP